ncbi:hypothetical protein F2Q70_00018673 [Brassica cretica]|uniref:Uncharacterized protein n=1 Tax=Brassica cretica TaxID=69181 RepID=A0A8S9HZN5_BRACR|nr:hypothetical protein F2Q70_00018673 [Brassica cretica]
MHGLIMESSKDICLLFESYLPNQEAYTHEITWRMFSTQLRSSSKKNQIKQSSYVTVMPFTNHVIFSSREFRPPEKLEMANLLFDEPTTNSIMPKVIIHVLNVQESLGLDGLQKESKTDLFETNGETNKNWLRKKMDFDQALKRHVLAHIRSVFFTFESPGRGYIKRQSKHILKISYDISCLESILIYNTFFDKSADPWIRKETLVSDLNKYLSCTYDPGNLMFILSVRDKQDQSPRGVRNISIDRAYKFEIWRWNSREFRPPEKLEMANLLSDETTTN